MGCDCGTHSSVLHFASFWLRLSDGGIANVLQFLCARGDNNVAFCCIAMPHVIATLTPLVLKALEPVVLAPHRLELLPDQALHNLRCAVSKFPGAVPRLEKYLQHIPPVV